MFPRAKAAIKQLSIGAGLYKPARAVHRAIYRSEREEFIAYQRLLSLFLRPGDLAFDVGANIGNRTEAMLSIGSRVIAFEPQPICAREIRARGNNNLTVIEAAIGATEGFAELYVKRHNTHSSLLPSWEGQTVDKINVPVTTLDAQIKQHGIPRYCKIDVEGYESSVLSGLTTPLDAISFEFASHNEKAITRTTDCLMLLKQLGCYYANFTEQDTARLMLSDWLPLGDLIKLFPNCTLKSLWGDIFVKRVT